MENIMEAGGFLSSRSTLASDISFIFAISFSGLFLISGYIATKNRGALHHRMIIFSMLSMIAYFVFYYRVRRLGLNSFSNQLDYEGEGIIKAGIFRPVFWSHFLIVCLSTFSAIYTILSGFKAAIKQNGRMLLENFRVSMSKTAWTISFIWLIFLFWWLRIVHEFDTVFIVIFLIFGYFLPASVALIIHKLLPFSEHRHRILGRLSMVLFACLIITSTLVYSMLYIF